MTPEERLYDAECLAADVALVEAAAAMPPPDPFPLAALLRAAVEAHCVRTGDSMADVARGASIHPQALSRVIRDGAEPRAQTVRPLLRALGLRVALVPA